MTTMFESISSLLFQTANSNDDYIISEQCKTPRIHLDILVRFAATRVASSRSERVQLLQNTMTLRGSSQCGSEVLNDPIASNL